MKSRMELEDIVPGCRCELCVNILLFISMHITTIYTKKTQTSVKTLDKVGSLNCKEIKTILKFCMRNYDKKLLENQN